MRKNYRKFPLNVNYESQSEYGIILDLDETLIKSKKYGLNVEDKIISDLLLSGRMFEIKLIDCVGPKGRGNIEYMKVLKRPGLDSFINWCINYFRIVIVYSAGQERYVESIVDKIFPINKHPYIVYHYDNCNVDKGYVNKPIKEMYIDNPELEDIVPMKRMFALDDNDYTYEENEKNGLLIGKFKPFKNLSNINDDDGELERIKKHILKYKNKKSIY